MTVSHLLPITGIDTHAHIFSQDLPQASSRRYSPDYDALIEDYLHKLDHTEISHGVLVQPSFLGTDNRYLCAALRKYPERLRGIAVVDPSINSAQLDELQDCGIVGVRLNLVGEPLEDYASESWQAFFKQITARQWQVEIQRGMEDLAAVLPAILASGVTVVVDHFGLPEGTIDPRLPSHKAFLQLLGHPRLYIKLSAAYRSQANAEQAANMLSLLRKASGGVERFLWGSDWPHTRYEHETDYASQLAQFNALLTDPLERQSVLVENPARLFQFQQNR